ncbi:MAG: peptigoglycan-binding protein LysM, partial [Treponemataceae bacterium]|nr:peptigoglycan-binding protein LysM [Treponemataceae bacterium]
MNNDVIGFKLADGSFYPVFEEGAAVEKQLELTTVRDDQTTIQLHLYKSPTGTMEEARYVETLILENLVPHPKEEPSLSLKIALDDEGNLSAEIIDPETGTSSSTNVSLVTLDEATLHEMETGDSDDGTSEFSVSEGSFTDEAADDM